jgi:hypothetical protein
MHQQFALQIVTPAIYKQAKRLRGVHAQVVTQRLVLLLLGAAWLVLACVWLFAYSACPLWRGLVSLPLVSSLPSRACVLCVRSGAGRRHAVQ